MAVIMVLVAGLIATSCSANGSEATTTTTPDTTTSSTDTTVPPTTPPTDVNDLAAGSGCKPGTPDSLPDGEWYGYIVDLDASEIEFDLACWFTGEAAELAATEDGAESPPPNDYYVRNENETTRPLPVGLDAEVEYLANGGDPNSATTSPYNEWYVEWEVSDFVPGYWLTVENGEVTRIEQQYVP